MNEKPGLEPGFFTRRAAGGFTFRDAAPVINPTALERNDKPLFVAEQGSDTPVEMDEGVDRPGTDCGWLGFPDNSLGR